MIKSKPCKQCGSVFHTKMYHKPRKPIKQNTPLPRASKRISQKGKRTLEYENWRDTIAKPHLDKYYGKICQECFGAKCRNQNLDVDHIINRGSRPDLKMDLTNVRYVGRSCHIEKTSRVRERV